MAARANTVHKVKGSAESLNLHSAQLPLTPEGGGCDAHTGAVVIMGAEYMPGGRLG